MTHDDIIRMAREAGHPFLTAAAVEQGVGPIPLWLERFAALVAADALVEPCCGNYYQCQKVCMPRAVVVMREEMIKAGWRQCAEGQETTQYCGLLEEAVKAEREACAKIADASRNNNLLLMSNPPQSAAARDIANAIRARGEKPNEPLAAQKIENTREAD